MEGTNQLDRVQEGAEGGAGTGRYDRGLDVPKGEVFLHDPVNFGEIETHEIYGAATPNVGSAYALPRSHPLWAPMDFEVKALKEEDERKLFEPPINPRKQLSKDQIEVIRKKNMEYFHEKKQVSTDRKEFLASRFWTGERKGYYFSTKRGETGYFLDYVQMRPLMRLDIGDRCEARYGPMRGYFRGEVIGIHDDDCSFDIRFEHGHIQRRIFGENVRAKAWIGKIKPTDGISRNLKAANPLTEKVDPAVHWYEQLLLFEQGKLQDEPQPPEGLFTSSSDEKNIAVVTDDERSVDAVVASGDVWKEKSSGYQQFWDAEGRPHRSGPPKSQEWYGSAQNIYNEDTATVEEPWDLCGDGTVTKYVEKKSTSHQMRPVAGDVVTFHVIIRRLDNTIVESSYKTTPWRSLLFVDEDDPAGVPNGTRYVQGLHEALASMRPTEISHFVVTPEKAYGRKGRYPVVPGYSKESPRGTWLKYELELLRIDKEEEEEERPSTALMIRDPAYGLLQRPGRGYDWEGMDHDAKNPYRDEGSCDWCGKPKRAMHGGKKFKRCSRCKVARYCSVECATTAWNHGHKDECYVPEDHDVVAISVALLKNSEDDDDSQQLTTTCSSTGTVKEWNDKVARALVPSGRTPRICVIVAYRNQLPLQDRQAQLFKFVPYMVAFLGYAEPKCEFTVVVATQTDDGRKFNRGRLMNAAFRDVCCGSEEYDSVIFHDVDLLPSEELMPYYSVPPKQGKPLHLAGAWRTKYRDRDFVGGALAIRPEDFINANGYPNDCWGWGLDDREFGKRMKLRKLRIVRPSEIGSYVDLDPINMRNVVLSDERGYYHEYWNMDMENGKLRPKIFGDIDPKYLREDHVASSGFSDISENSQVVAKTTEFGGRVIRLLYALENKQERKEGTVALVSARQALKATYENPMLQGPVADAAMAQTRALAQQGNLKSVHQRIPTNLKLLTPEQRYQLQGGKKPLMLSDSEASSSSKKLLQNSTTSRPRRRLAL